MKKFIAITFLVLFLSPNIGAETKERISNMNAIIIEKDGGRGGPYYSYILFESGEQIFIGELFTKVEGVVFKYVPKSKYKKLKDFLTNNIFAKYPDGLKCNEFSSAEGMNILYLYENGLLKKLEHDHACYGFEGERELYELEKKFEEMLDLNDYIKYDLRNRPIPVISDQNVFIYTRSGAKVLLFESGLQVSMISKTIDDSCLVECPTDVFFNKVPQQRYEKLIELLNKYKFNDFIDFDTLMDIYSNKINIQNTDKITEEEEYKSQEKPFRIDYFHQHKCKIKKVIHDSFSSKYYKHEKEMYRLEAEIEDLLELKRLLNKH